MKRLVTLPLLALALLSLGGCASMFDFKPFGLESPKGFAKATVRSDDDPGRSLKVKLLRRPAGRTLCYEVTGETIGEPTALRIEREGREEPVFSLGGTGCTLFQSRELLNELEAEPRKYSAELEVDGRVYSGDMRPD